MKFLFFSGRSSRVHLLLRSLCIIAIALHFNAAGAALQNAHGRKVLPESSAALKQGDAARSERVEFSANRKRVDGRDVDGFSARQAVAAQEEKLMPPAGLKPLEEEAWLAMARRHKASGELGTFYPARYGEAFVVEGQGVRVAMRPVGGSDVEAQIENGQVIYRKAYPATDSVHVVSGGRSEEFLYLESEDAPREFVYEIREVSAGTRVEVVNGEVRFTNEAGTGVKIEAPWAKKANGARVADAVHWELDTAAQGGPRRLRLVVAAKLSYPAVIDPSWSATGNLATSRELHTATLLNSGKVLVVGGDTSTHTAELYDPATGTWSATGSTTDPRYRYTATLLPTGKVLVAGGIATDFTSLRSAELYDPAIGTWSTTAAMSDGRYDHTATLLTDGRVLVAGGYNQSNDTISKHELASAELYDPKTGTWTTTGSLSTARDTHTATRLANGKVLVAGGFNNGIGNIGTAELFDPGAGTWSAAGTLVMPRSAHTATLLSNGKVLLAGGNGATGSAELFNPTTGTWSATGNLNTARAFHTSTLLPNGKVMVAGRK